MTKDNFEANHTKFIIGGVICSSMFYTSIKKSNPTIHKPSYVKQEKYSIIYVYQKALIPSFTTIFSATKLPL